MSYFYGPVPSRRLGFSLGVDLIPKKVCSFDCIYCHTGKTTKKTIERFRFIDFKKFKEDLGLIIQKYPKIDYITISGSGEPTLHKDLDKVIKLIREVSDNRYKICVITNSSLLYRKDVRSELLGADLIIPSLDAVSSKIFEKINQPHKDIKLNAIINGLVKLRQEFKGEIWLEIMFVGNINDDLVEASKFKKLINRIKPDRVQFNIPVRPPLAVKDSMGKVILPKFSQLKKIAKIIGGKIEITGNFQKQKQKSIFNSVPDMISDFLKRRPATSEDLEKSFGLNKIALKKYIDILLSEGKIKECNRASKKYFIYN